MHRWLVWNLLFPLHEFIKSHPTFSILREMERADCLSGEDLAELRRRKLQKLIDYCHDHVPRIREVMLAAGVARGQIRDPMDLALLPVTTKADIRKHRRELRSDSAGHLQPLATGGSTGDPLIFDISKRRTASRVASRQRVARWWGLSVGDPEIAIWGPPVELTHQDRVRDFRDSLMRQKLLSAFEMDEATMSEYLDVLQQRRWAQIFAYPSAIHQLCLHAQRTNRDLRCSGIKVIFVTGEVLYPHQRELISEVFNCPVADGYGGRDSGFIAHECPHGGMHILSDATIVELLDCERKPVQPGQPGEIVVTDLYSHEAPFVRYATGDTAVLSARQCTCGRAHPLLEHIQGRPNDAIVAPDGRVINSLSVIYAIRALEGVERFRIVQKSADRLHVQLVRNDSFPNDGPEHLRAEWSRLLRAPVTVTVEYVSRLENEKSGKFRHVISELPQMSTVRTEIATGTKA